MPQAVGGIWARTQMDGRFETEQQLCQRKIKHLMKLLLRIRVFHLQQIKGRYMFHERPFASLRVTEERHSERSEESRSPVERG
jgi:hypothetical protein